PAFVRGGAVGPRSDRIRRVRWMSAALKGLAPAVIGMTTVALAQMLPHAAPDVLTGGLVVATVLAMVARGVGPLPLMAAGAVVGAGVRAALGAGRGIS